jgi:hypothetical protein
MPDKFSLRDDAYLRVFQIVGRDAVTEDQARMNRARKRGPKRARNAIPALIPVAPSTWWNWVREGRAPKPAKIGGVTVWKAAQIRALIK